MKYRIEQEGNDIFIPQYKGLLWGWNTWASFYTPSGSFGTKSFRTLDEARHFLDEQVRIDISIEERKIKTIHNYP